MALYDWIYARIRDSTQPAGKPQWQQVERLARQTWCLLRRERAKNGQAQRPRVKSAVWSMAWLPWRRGGLEISPSFVVKTGLSQLTFLSRMEITDGGTGLRLMFWVPRPRRRAVPWIPLSACAKIGSWLMAVALATRRQAKTARLLPSGG